MFCTDDVNWQNAIMKRIMKLHLFKKTFLFWTWTAQRSALRQYEHEHQALLKAAKYDSVGQLLLGTLLWNPNLLLSYVSAWSSGYLRLVSGCIIPDPRNCSIADCVQWPVGGDVTSYLSDISAFLAGPRRRQYKLVLWGKRQQPVRD